MPEPVREIRQTLQDEPEAAREEIQPAVLTRVPAGEQGTIRQPLSQPHHRGIPETDRGTRRGERGHQGHCRRPPGGEGARVRRPAAGRGHQGKHRHPVHGTEGGGGREAVRQHLPGTARQLLQRAGHLCRGEGTGHAGDHRRHLP